jgi:hypothetical protein
LLNAGVLGEVARAVAFTALLRSLAHRLPRILAGSPRSVHDSAMRCTVDLTAAEFRGAARWCRTWASMFMRGADISRGWFTAGKLTFTSGANDGLAMEVKTHRRDDDGVSIELWQTMPEPVAPGDTFTVTAGCDKRFATCRDRFDNTVNLRGFPHIPGNDRRWRAGRGRHDGGINGGQSDSSAEFNSGSEASSRRARAASDPRRQRREARAWIGTPTGIGTPAGMLWRCFGLVAGGARSTLGARGGARLSRDHEAARCETPALAAGRHMTEIGWANSCRAMCPVPLARGPAKHAAIATAPDRMVHAHTAPLLPKPLAPLAAPAWRSRPLSRRSTDGFAAVLICGPAPAARS